MELSRWEEAAHLKTARTVRGAAWNMVFWDDRALAATVPRSPSLSYSAFTFCTDFPVAWLRACSNLPHHCGFHYEPAIAALSRCLTSL